MGIDLVQVRSTGELCLALMGGDILFRVLFLFVCLSVYLFV